MGVKPVSPDTRETEDEWKTEYAYGIELGPEVPFFTKLIAYHEAGHTVMRYLQGRRIRCIRVFPDERAGYVEPYQRFVRLPPDPETAREQAPYLEKEALFCCAGNAAESILTHRKHWHTSSGDYAHAIDILSHLCDNRRELSVYIRSFWVRARNAIQLPRNWYAVQAIAESLIEQGTECNFNCVLVLDGQETRFIIESAMEEYAERTARFK